MALRVWLPLTVDNENRGMSDTKFDGYCQGTGYSPIGGSMVFKNTTENVIRSTTKDYNYVSEDFSWCIWLKKDYSSMTASAMYAFTVGRADAGGRGYGLQISSSTRVSVRFGSSSWTLPASVPDNEWHHIAFTRKGNDMRAYVDGKLSGSYTFGGTLPTYSDGNGVGLGCFWYTSAIYPLIGELADFRIYDHCLSARDVKDIALANVVHYPLNGLPGIHGNPNLLTWTRECSKDNPIVHKLAGKDGVVTYTDSLITVTPGKTYYIQCRSDGELDTHATSRGTVTNYFTLWLYLRNAGTTKAVGNYDSPINLSKTNAYINDYAHGIYVWKWTAPTNAQDICLRTNTYSDGSTAVTVKFWDIKIEEGSYTAYSPGVNQPLYTRLGYNDKRIADCSGYGHDGEVIGTLTSSGNTPKNSAAVDFAHKGYIKTKFSMRMEKMTIAFWFLTRGPASIVSDEHRTVFCTSDDWNDGDYLPNGLSMWRQSSNSKWHAAIRLDDGTGVHTRINGDPPFDVGAWHHYAITYDGTVIKWYCDGTALGTARGSGAVIHSDLYLGTTAYKSDYENDIEDGIMCDFRLYGTELTSKEINELVSVPVKFVSDGEIWSNCSISELYGKTRIAKKGLFSPNVKESSSLTGGTTQQIFADSIVGNSITEK